MLLRSERSFNSHKRLPGILQIAQELKENYNFNSITFHTDKQTQKFNRYSNQQKPKTKFNGKENASSFLQTAMIYQDKASKTQKTINPSNNRLPLSSLINMRNCYGFNRNDVMWHGAEKQEKVLKTKEKIEFYDELFDKVHKIKKFKEDDIPFTHSRILPKVQWMKIDNDILTDEEQMNDARKMLHGWLGDTIKLIQEDDCYMANHVERNFIMLRNNRK